MPESPTPEQARYLNIGYGPIGKVVITNRGNPGPGLATLLESPNGQSLDIGHIIAIPTSDGQVTFAVTLDPDVRNDLDPNDLVYEVDNEAIGASVPMTQRPTARIWKLGIACNTSGTSRPPTETPVFYASREGVEFALGMNTIPASQRIPIGVIINGDGQAYPVYLHAEYLLGPQGVHANWGGLSGMSGKTSKKALCELTILANRRQLGLRCAVVVFATKGSDELFRDLPADPHHPFWQAQPELLAQLALGAFINTDLQENLSDAHLYEVMGLQPEPFAPVRLYVPCAGGQWSGYRTPATSAGLGSAQIFPFEWSIRQIAPYMTLFASTDADDKLRAMESEVMAAMHYGYKLESEATDKRHQIQCLQDLDAFFEYARNHVDPKSRRWHGHHIETINRAQSRYLSIFQRAVQVVSPLAVEDHQALPLTELTDGAVWVIDLSQLKDEARMLVIFKVITELHELMQANRLPLDRLLLDMDELNQHAPRRQTSAYTKIVTGRLQDISERARTDGVILLAAQQTLSQVDDRVEGNFVTRFYGMLGAQEAREGVYGFTELERFVVGKLEPGEMLVQHPVLRHRVKVRVPRPTFLRGKDGQALLQAASPAILAGQLRQVMGRGGARAAPELPQLEHLIDRFIQEGGLPSDLEQAAAQVAKTAPLEGAHNNGLATLKLFRTILSRRTGIKLE